MHILKIVILSLAERDLCGLVTGQVAFTVAYPAGRTEVLTIDVETAYSRRIHPEAILAGAAIRSLRRLPDIRNGKARLSFEHGVSPQRHKNLRAA